MIRTRVDHEAKRRAVARATWAVIRRKGLDRTGIRDIADELGSTVSVVTHYFRTRDQLIEFACDEVFAAYRRRIHEADAGPRGLDWLEHWIVAGLPVEPGRERGWEVWIAFMGHAIGRPTMQRDEAARQEVLSQLLAGELRRLEAEGAIPAGLDLELETDLLTALVDGLGISRVIKPERYPAARVKQVIRHHLVTRLGYRPPSDP